MKNDSYATTPTHSSRSDPWRISHQSATHCIHWISERKREINPRVHIIKIKHYLKHLPLSTWPCTILKNSVIPDTGLHIIMNVFLSRCVLLASVLYTPFTKLTYKFVRSRKTNKPVSICSMLWLSFQKSELYEINGFLGNRIIALLAYTQTERRERE